MQYLHNFITAFVATEIIEIGALFVFLWYFLKNRSLERKQIILGGFFASLLTHPSVWFVFPVFMVWSQNLYLILAESFAFLVEAVFYRYFLRLNWKISFLVSFLCNFSSFLVGYLLITNGWWFYW